MTRSSLIALAVTVLLIVAVMAQTGSNAEPGQTKNFWILTVAKESPADEYVADLHNPRTVTVCSDNMNRVFLSIDGKHWHRPYGDGACIQVPPIRLVKLQRERNPNYPFDDNLMAEVYATY